jgi:hypothetical protein
MHVGRDEEARRAPRAACASAMAIRRTLLGDEVLFDPLVLLGDEEGLCRTRLT